MSYIYILYRSDSALIKIGHTKFSGSDRASNYTDGKWLVYKEYEVPSFLSASIESKTHELLKAQGVWVDPSITNGTAVEIFNCSKNEGDNCVKKAMELIYSDANHQLSKFAERNDYFEVTLQNVVRKEESHKILRYLFLEYPEIFCIVSLFITGFIHNEILTILVVSINFLLLFFKHRFDGLLYLTIIFFASYFCGIFMYSSLV